jgi:hypothetical protein
MSNLRPSPTSRPSSSHFVLTLWTDDPALARLADSAGVDRIGLDLEVYGKAERQPKTLKTWISPHSEDKLPALREAMGTAKLFCRINPINPGTADEIERLIERFGVQVLMLPMFTTPREVERFVELVDGRATTVLLLENRTVLGAGLRFGVGGIGRSMNNDQVIPGDLIYAQYPRLGATAALIARSFFTAKEGQPPVDVTDEIRRARDRLAWWGRQSPEAWEDARKQLLAKAGGATW